MNPLRRRVTVGLFAVALVAAACGSSSTSTSTEPSRGFTRTTAGFTAYIPNLNDSRNVSTIDTATNTAGAKDIALPAGTTQPVAIAIAPR